MDIDLDPDSRVASLVHYCQQTIINNLSQLDSLEDIPYRLQLPILRACSPSQLDRLEQATNQYTSTSISSQEEYLRNADVDVWRLKCFQLLGPNAESLYTSGDRPVPALWKNEYYRIRRNINAVADRASSRARATRQATEIDQPRALMAESLPWSGGAQRRKTQSTSSSTWRKLVADAKKRTPFNPRQSQSKSVTAIPLRRPSLQHSLTASASSSSSIPSFSSSLAFGSQVATPSPASGSSSTLHSVTTSTSQLESNTTNTTATAAAAATANTTQGSLNVHSPTQSLNYTRWRPNHHITQARGENPINNLISPNPSSLFIPKQSIKPITTTTTHNTNTPITSTSTSTPTSTSMSMSTFTFTSTSTASAPSSTTTTTTTTNNKVNPSPTSPPLTQHNSGKVRSNIGSTSRFLPY